ncbi:MAG TPA: hypothetical protein VFD73_23035, partial [Gemmatimonadales bacterium]|nr:hypothetical protein [Gemmatimonadales bacterium]
QVKLVLGEPAVHERGLERVAHLLAADVRRQQVAVAFCAFCRLVSRPGYPADSSCAQSTKA